MTQRPNTRPKPVEASAHRRGLRPTGAGVRYILLLLVMGFAAYNTRNNLLYLMFSVGLAALVVSFVAAWHSLRNLSLERGEASDLYAETRCREQLRIRNRSSWLDNYGLEIEELDAPARSTRSRLSYVGSGQTRPFVLEKTYPRRGIYKCESLRVSTRFPFGLIRAVRPLLLERHITVFPKVTRVDISFLFRGPSGQIPERQHAGDSEELLRIRDYVKGDDYHHIHWKATAKLGKVMVREFASHEQRRFSVIFDNSAVEAGDGGMASELFERAVSAAASLVTHLASHASFFRFTSCDEIFPYGASAEHLRGVLGHLAVIDINHRPNIDLVDSVRQSLRRGDVVLVLGTEASNTGPWSKLSSSNLHVVDSTSLFVTRGQDGI